MITTNHLSKLGIDYVEIRESIVFFTDYMDLYGDKAIISSEDSVIIFFSSGPIYANEKQLDLLLQSLSPKWRCLYHKNNYGYLYFNDSSKNTDKALDSFLSEYKTFRKEVKLAKLTTKESFEKELCDFDMFPEFTNSTCLNDLNFQLIKKAGKDTFSQLTNIESLVALQNDFESNRIDESELTSQQIEDLENLYFQQLKVIETEQDLTKIRLFISLSYTAERMRKAGLHSY